jgi:virginiamycin A acetyltransferase
MIDKKHQHPITINGSPLTSVVFLKHFITKAHIQVGDYTYYHAHNGEAAQLENTCVLYDDPSPTATMQLNIGKCCQIASDTTFICPYGQHHINSFTTFPVF